MKRIKDLKSTIQEMRRYGFDYPASIEIKIPDAKTYLGETMKYFVNEEERKTFVWLDEYDAVAEWLSDNEGKGLCLYGINGNGKTILIQRVIPILIFRFYNKIVRCYNSNEINSDEEILKKRLLSIDDVGVEEQAVWYGNKRWIFPEVIDLAEKNKNMVIFSSNLDGKGFIEKYGVRTFERIVSTTKRIEFKHKSFR